MTLQSETELTNTRQKLREVESWYADAQNNHSEGEHVRQHTLRSYRKLIKQLKEEIARYESVGGRSG